MMVEMCRAKPRGPSGRRSLKKPGAVLRSGRPGAIRLAPACEPPLPSLLVLSYATLHARPLDQIGKPVDDSVVPGSEVRFKVALAGAKDNVKVAKLEGRFARLHC